MSPFTDGIRRELLATPIEDWETWDRLQAAEDDALEVEREDWDAWEWDRGVIAAVLVWALVIYTALSQAVGA